MPDLPFQAGDLVCVVDGSGVAIGSTTVARALKSRIVTSCGRVWSRRGRHMGLRWVPPSRRPRLSIRRPHASEATP